MFSFGMGCQTSTALAMRAFPGEQSADGPKRDASGAETASAEYFCHALSFYSVAYCSHAQLNTISSRSILIRQPISLDNVKTGTWKAPTTGSLCEEPLQIL